MIYHEQDYHEWTFVAASHKTNSKNELNGHQYMTVALEDGPELKAQQEGNYTSRILLTKPRPQ